jgi:hypothetical protein
VDEVVDQLVHVGDLVAPEAACVAHLGALLELAFLADLLAQPRQLAAQALVEVDHVVEGLGEAPLEAGPFGREAHGAVALLERVERGEQQAGFLGREQALAGIRLGARDHGLGRLGLGAPPAR